MKNKMELAYLFIKGRVKATAPGFEDIENTPFKVFKDSEFCFSNEHDISYNSTTGFLSIKNNPEFISGFFDEGGKIKSVTSLVGMNGTGKSSVLEFVKSVNNYDFHYFPYKFLAVFKLESGIGDNRSCEFQVIRHDSLPFTDDSKKEFPKNCNLGNVSVYNGTKTEVTVPKYRTIYLSNILEVNSTRFTDINTDPNQLDDISSTGLLNADIVKKLNKEARFSFEDCYHSFRLMECNRQVRFLLDKEKYRMSKFILPTFVEIQPDLFYESEVQEALKHANFGRIAQLFSEVEKPLKELKDKFCFNLHKSVYYYLVRYFTLEAINAPLDIFRMTDDAFKSNVVSNDRIKGLVQSIIDAFKQANAEEKMLQKFINILSVLKYVDELTSEDFMHGLNANPVLILHFDQNKTFFSNYSESLFITGYLNLDWRFKKYSTGEMSSGEKAMLSIFSRFNELREKYQRDDEKSCNLVILIDEGDQLLHPEWQREFLFYLFDFLPKIFSQSNSIQVIITSHSPFITSDLPRYCIMYLEKDLNGISKVIFGKDKPHTLGANIHQLYRDSFYMPNSMMGEFARTKIDELIKELQPIQNFETPEQREGYIKRAELIGERFLATKIKDLINSKSESTNDSN